MKLIYQYMTLTIIRYFLNGFMFIYIYKYFIEEKGLSIMILLITLTLVISIILTGLVSTMGETNEE